MMKLLRETFSLTPITTLIWFCFLGCAYWIVAFSGLSWFLIPVFAFGFLAVHEVLAYVFGTGIFPSAERVARIYQWGAYVMGPEGNIEKQGDLTEGYFNGDFTKSIGQATSDKYDEVIKLLNLKKGDKVLDVGSGLGDFLVYLKSKGIEGVGVTVSPDQLAIAAKRGLDVRLFDFRNPLPQDLVGQFDAVTFMGCIEHFVQNYSFKKREAALLVYANAFRSALRALSSHSKAKKVFSTTQHASVMFDWKLKDYLQGYLVHGHYSGIYPKEGFLEDASKGIFKIIHKYDASVDYQYSSLACSKHFGLLKIDWNLKKLLYNCLFFLVNPFAITTWLYVLCDTWMWQFGGRTIVPESKRPIKTIWYVYEPAVVDK